MTTYTKLTSKNCSYVLLENDDLEDFKETMELTDCEETEVTVDPNNCVKLWTYDNEYEDKPTTVGEFYYEFDNVSDMDDWLEFNNSDGHQNSPYYVVQVLNGVETVLNDYFN